LPPRANVSSPPLKYSPANNQEFFSVKPINLHGSNLNKNNALRVNIMQETVLVKIGGFNKNCMIQFIVTLSLFK